MADRIMIPFTNEHFAAWCMTMLGQPYWYGTVVYKCTESLRTRKAKQYPSHYGSSRTSRYKDDIAKKKVCADCVGGCKGYAWTNGGQGVVESIGTDKTFTNKYGANGCPDKSANGMFSYAKSKGMAWGTIDTIPDIVGLALHRDGHVGYTVGGGYAVEWRGFNYGCVKTKIAGRGWKYWYKLPFIDYNDWANVIVPTEVPLGSRQLEKGMVGTDVKAMQELLMQLGYELPKYGADSDFGNETEKAVIAFQKAEGIKADGKYGAETHEALMDAVADDDEGKKEEEPEETPSVPVEPEAPAEPKPVGTTVVIVAEGGGKVNVRVGNDTSYKRITTVPAGTTFEYVATAANGWNAVVVAGQVGWVSGKYSKVV
ncbi:MAG: peptidoglycan-binding protein [Clostridia bacterium]|nr:peptidoglycan-binding protein [Clostridia bacterium]